MALVVFFDRRLGGWWMIILCGQQGRAREKSRNLLLLLCNCIDFPRLSVVLDRKKLDQLNLI
jgi:hypothetical protein